MAAEERPGEETTAAWRSDHSFDELAKGIAKGKLSRRGVLRMLGGALLGGALASVPGIAWAKPKPEPKPGRKCVRNNQCPSTQACVNGACVCPFETTFCGGSCVYSQCSGADEQFNTSTCKCECPSGRTLCDGQCIGCINAGEVLDPITCECSCPPGTELCELREGYRFCLSTSCPEGQVRQNCECVSCSSVQVICNGMCVGSCGAGEVRDENCECVCPDGKAVCNETCQPITRECCWPSAVCEDPVTNEVTCCFDNEICTNDGQCVACPEGQTACGQNENVGFVGWGTCVDLDTNPDHCGQCFNDCESLNCVGGTCQACSTDADCRADTICNNGTCISNDCATENDCPLGYNCVNGTCKSNAVCNEPNMQLCYDYTQQQEICCPAINIFGEPWHCCSPEEQSQGRICGTVEGCAGGG